MGKDKVHVLDPGGLPKGMTLADLGRKSIRRNALIADLLHRIDFIEKAGTGIKRIRDEVREQGCPQPEFETNGFFTAIFRPNPDVRAQVGAHDEAHEAHAEVRSGPSRGPVGAQSEQVLNALRQTPLAMKELVTVLGLRSKTGALKRKVNELLSGNWIEYTIPAKPKSRLQKYRITPIGEEILKQQTNMKAGK
jgi:ATP-dependent DNA helicase RecG